MKRLALLTVLALVPASMALAQGSLDEEINAELDRMYQQRSSRSVGTPSVQVNVHSNQEQASSSNSTAASIQKQPTTVIEAAPLGESRAEKFRKARQDAELRTEEAMVERIEASRLEDERRRAEALFGDRFHSMMGPRQEQQPVQVQMPVQEVQPIQAPVVVQQPVAVQQPVQPVVVAPVAPVAPVVVAPVEPVVVIHPDTEVRGIEEVRAEVVVEKAQVLPEETEKKNYFSGILGMTEYQNTKNVRGNMSLGFAIGTKLDDRILVEGNFVYSSFDIEQRDSGPLGFDPMYARITSMDQYSGTGIVKYQLLGGTIRPTVGGVAGYTYRYFADKQLAFPNNDTSSHAIDVGLQAGVDVELSKRFSIGADVRYMWNVYNRTNNKGLQTRFSQSVLQSNTPIEEISYMTFSLVGRATF